MTLYRPQPATAEVIQARDSFDQLAYWLMMRTGNQAVSIALHTIQTELERLEADARKRETEVIYG